MRTEKELVENCWLTEIALKANIAEILRKPDRQIVKAELFRLIWHVQRDSFYKGVMEVQYNIQRELGLRK